jgi:hypothetical protein
MELQRIVAEQKPRAMARARAVRIVNEDVQANRGSALAAYEKVGRHNPAWDATARELIEAFTYIPGQREAYRRRIEKLTAEREALEKAKCDDPFILYLMARAHGQEAGVDMTALAKDLKAAADALEASTYPAERKCWAHARYAEQVLRAQLWAQLHDWKKELGHEVDLAIAEWPDTVRGKGMTDPMLYELAQVLEYDWTMVKGTRPGVYGDRGELCDKLLPAWQQAMPKATGPLVFKGAIYTKYAWDARGSGVANTVTQEGWKAMQERLTVAQEALEKAYAMDPADPRAAEEMLGVELGQGEGRDRMELWWKRAMDANPDDYAACSSKLYYLEPKWYGSAADMIQFGRECLRGGNWEGRIPFILVSAHWNLSQYAPDRDGYFAQPEVWEDLRSVYEPYLKRYPGAVWDRSYYAYYATLSNHWDVARQQFEILGDNPELKPFGTKAAYEYLRERAKNGGKP